MSIYMYGNMGRNSVRTCFWAIDCICWNMILSSSFPRTIESNEELLEELLVPGFRIVGVIVCLSVLVYLCVSV